MPKNTPSFTNSLSEDNTTPLYFQLITLIKRQIHSGTLKPGDLLPSESQFCAQYNISRTTVRQALNQLAEEHLIIRRRGKGSFIAKEKLNRNLNRLYSFTEDMISLGLTPHSKILEKSIIKPPDDIAKFLGIPQENTEVLKLTRIRLANNEPLLLETTYIPLFLCPEIYKEDFTSNSLYSILRTKFNLNLYRAIETYEAIKLNKETADLLKCKTNIAAFNIQRIAFLETDIAFEVTSSIARSDKSILKVELFANKDKVSFTRKINL